MKRLKLLIPVCIASLLSLFFLPLNAQEKDRISFNSGWKFRLDSVNNYDEPAANDDSWRILNLPHDWSIEGKFDEKNPSTVSGGALPDGIGWYRKTFSLPISAKGRNIFIDFDGVYLNSQVWINGHLLGMRPNGFISFRYDLTPYLYFGAQKNVIAVKADNSRQPNCRWYSGSGIYRNVWLVTTGRLFVDHWGTCITTPRVNSREATVHINTILRNTGPAGISVTVTTTLYDPSGKPVASKISAGVSVQDTTHSLMQELKVANPLLWSDERPNLYKAVTEISGNAGGSDKYTTPFGIRYFTFDANRGFLLNGKPVKIRGVCDHHDLGCLGSAINTRALERQLEILKAMGCNGIRTSHNPPAPELLDLCDKMGFIVMDEAFDMWKRPKNPYDYHLVWDEWHKRDLEDQILRDRNHPSVIIWSIGNEIPEQGGDKNDESGMTIARELSAIIKSLDTTRPVTSALNSPYPDNRIIRSGALDLIGYNYDHNDFATFHERFPGKKFIGTETVSALETRGHYDMPADSILRWPSYWDKPFTGDPGQNCSAFDNRSAPWGSTHEETWKIVKKYDFLSGMYVWTGFDYIGEPTPYSWPARSSYFGIIDLAGFPKDVYYMYQSEWTHKPVLHILPHWNWSPGDSVDVWAYYSQADEVELFLNGRSLGVRKKKNEDLHVSWKVAFMPGSLKAVSRKNGVVVLTRETRTAGKPARIRLSADRNAIHADGRDLSYITVRIEDAAGNLVPDAGNDVAFRISGPGMIAGVDNGSETSMESFKADHRKAFNGLCLAVLQSVGKPGSVNLTATAEGLQSAQTTIEAK